MPAIHVAIVNHRVAGALLAGAKSIESRFSRCRRAPIDCVTPGDIIHFKLSGGGFIGTCRAAHVQQYTTLTPGQLAALRRQHNHAICASAGYWRAHLACRFGLLIWLRPLCPPPPGLRIGRQFGNAWIVLGRP
jgi:hypothetical protein